MAIYTRTGDEGETGLIGGRRVSKGSMQMAVIGAVDELNSSLGLAVAMTESVMAIQNAKVKMQDGGKNLDIGLARLVGQLRDVQRELFEMGAELAKTMKPQDQRIRRAKEQKSRKAQEEKGLSFRGEMGRMAEEFVRGRREEDRESDRGGESFPAEGQDRGEEEKRIEEMDKYQPFDAGKLEQLIDEMEGDLPRVDQFILPGGGVIGAQLMVVRSVCRRTEREFVRFLNLKRKVKNSKPHFKAKNLKSSLTIEQLSNEAILRYLNRLSDYLFVANRWANWLMEEEESVWQSQMR